MELRINQEEEPHLAKGIWTLTREQGNKLLASRSLIPTACEILVAVSVVMSNVLLLHCHTRHSFTDPMVSYFQVSVRQPLHM